MEERGLAKGMERGLAKGMERGLVKGMEQGLAKGRTDGIATSLYNLMETLSLSAEQAMAALKIPEEERQKYLDLLQKE